MHIRSLTVQNTQWPGVIAEIIENLFYLLHIHALGIQYQNKHRQCTRILLSHHFINNKPNPNVFKPLKGHLQGVYLIHFSSVSQQNELTDVTFRLMCSVNCATQQLCECTM